MQEIFRKDFNIEIHMQSVFCRAVSLYHEEGKLVSNNFSWTMTVIKYYLEMEQEKTTTTKQHKNTEQKFS